MQYRHTAKFDELLLEAFNLAAEAEYSMIAVCRNAGVVKSRMTIMRWCAQSENGVDRELLRPDLAEKLWAYLSPSFVELAISNAADSAARRKSLFSEQEVADGVLSFFAAYEKNNRNYSTKGLSGKFIGYKRSFLHKDVEGKPRIIRSEFEIEIIDDSYFRTSELQMTKYPDGQVASEKSEGFGFIKTDKLWLIMQEKEFNQPHIFCFPSVIPFDGSTYMLKGYLIEAGKKFGDIFFHSPIFMMPLSREKARYREIFGAELDITEYVATVYRNDVKEMWSNPDIAGFLDSNNYT